MDSNTSQITEEFGTSKQPEAKAEAFRANFEDPSLPLADSREQRIHACVNAIEATRQMLFGGGWAPEQDPWVARALEASGVLLRALMAMESAKEVESHVEV